MHEGLVFSKAYFLRFRHGCCGNAKRVLAAAVASRALVAFEQRCLVQASHNAVRAGHVDVRIFGDQVLVDLGRRQ